MTFGASILHSLSLNFPICKMKRLELSYSGILWVYKKISNFYFGIITGTKSVA